MSTLSGRGGSWMRADARSACRSRGPAIGLFDVPRGGASRRGAPARRSSRPRRSASARRALPRRSVDPLRSGAAPRRSLGRCPSLACSPSRRRSPSARRSLGARQSPRSRRGIDSRRSGLPCRPPRSSPLRVAPRSVELGLCRRSPPRVPATDWPRERAPGPPARGSERLPARLGRLVFESAPRLRLPPGVCAIKSVPTRNTTRAVRRTERPSS